MLDVGWRIREDFHVIRKYILGKIATFNIDKVIIKKHFEN